MTNTTVSTYIVHMVGTDNGVSLPLYGDDVRTLCKLTGCPTEGEPNDYVLTGAAGNAFHATTRKRFTTCLKCKRELEKFHAARVSQPTKEKQRA